MSLLIHNGFVVTMDDKNQVIENGAVYVRDDLIHDIGTSDELVSKYNDVEKKIDARGRIVMPGLICSHMHFYSAFATGMPLPPFPKGFYNILKHLWWKIDKALLEDDVYFSALLGYIQAIKSGTTAVIDHHASPSYIKGSLDLIEKAAREAGVRSNLCYEVTDRNGKEGAIIGLEENERFIKKCQASQDDLITGLLGLHASFTLSHKSMQKAQQIVEDLDTGVHIHVAEGKVDVEDAKENYNMTPIQRIEQYNLLNSKTVLAHCIHLEDHDYDILKKYDINIAHQPRSNMNNAVGTLDIFKLKENEIPYGMGTDGMSSDMKAELMVGSLIHKHQQEDNTVGTVEVFNALFKENPKIFKKITGTEVGLLSVGAKADIIISDYHPKTPISPDNIVGHVMFGVINEPVDTTIIGGKIRMENKQILDLDEYTITKKTRELAQKVWNRIE